MNATMCPHNPDLIAFVNSGDIWVSHLVSRTEVMRELSEGCLTLLTNQSQVRLTYCHNAIAGGVADDPLSAGLPSYVMQEEFNR